MILALAQAFLASFSATPQAISPLENQGEITAVIRPGKVWLVWYRATFWTARSLTQHELNEGDLVKIVGWDSLTLMIEPWSDEDWHS